MTEEEIKTQNIINIVMIGCGQIVTHHIDAIFGSSIINSNIYNNNKNNNKNDNTNSRNHKRKCHLLAVCDPSSERREIIIDLVIRQQQQQQQQSEGTTTDMIIPTKDDTLQFDTFEDLIEYSHNNNNNSNNNHNESSSSVSTTFLHSIDIILIAVPHDIHESIAIRALQMTEKVVSSSNTTTPSKKTYIVLEKPIAITHEACEQLRLASIQYSYRLIIAEQSPYWPAVRLAHDLIHRQNCIGSIISIASYYYESMKDNITSGSIEQNTGNLGWRGSIQRSGGGIIIDGGLHWIRPIREISNQRISKVFGVTCNIPTIQNALGMEGETLGHALFELQHVQSSSLESNSNPLDQGESSSVLTNKNNNADANANYNNNNNNDSNNNNSAKSKIIATYSACMLPSPAVMAYDTCPYLRITGTIGEIIISGTGLQKHVHNAGGLRLYNPDYPNGKDMMIMTSENENDDDDDNNNDDPTTLLTHHDRTDFFMAFYGLWDEIYRIRNESDDIAAYETIIRAIDDVKTVLAIYKSATQTQQWEYT